MTDPDWVSSAGVSVRLRADGTRMSFFADTYRTTLPPSRGRFDTTLAALDR